jgi:hypothetical protein
MDEPHSAGEVPPAAGDFAPFGALAEISRADPERRGLDGDGAEDPRMRRAVMPKRQQNRLDL